MRFFCAGGANGKYIDAFADELLESAMPGLRGDPGCRTEEPCGVEVREDGVRRSICELRAGVVDSLDEGEPAKVGEDAAEGPFVELEALVDEAGDVVICNMGSTELTVKSIEAGTWIMSGCPSGATRQCEPRTESKIRDGTCKGTTTLKSN
jgi:hypothetical protein